MILQGTHHCISRAINRYPNGLTIVQELWFDPSTGKYFLRDKTGEMEDEYLTEKQAKRIMKSKTFVKAN